MLSLNTRETVDTHIAAISGAADGLLKDAIKSSGQIEQTRPDTAKIDQHETMGDPNNEGIVNGHELTSVVIPFVR